MIFEKSCNSSTLLMELFMICGLITKTHLTQIFHGLSFMEWNNWTSYKCERVRITTPNEWERLLKSQVLSFQLFFPQTFGDIAITRELIFFSYYTFTAKKYYVWKTLMKTCLVMVTTWGGVGRQLQYIKLLRTSKRLDRFTWNLKFTSVMILQIKWKTKFWKTRTVHL